jgi:outer membrane protein OmpA-like peptidoglycan-associated protein
VRSRGYSSRPRYSSQYRSTRKRSGRRPGLTARSLALVAAVALVLVAAVSVSALRGDDDSGADNDVLIVATGTRNETQPALPAAARDLLLDDAKADTQPADPPQAVVLGVDGDGSSTTRTIDLTPRRGRSIEKSPDRRATAAAANVDLVDSAVAGVVATRSGHALLAGLQEAGRRAEATIVICSSGIDTDDPMDLRALGFDYPPAKLVAFLRRQRELPDLAGREVYLALGPAAGSQRRLTTPIARQLGDTWVAVLEAAGARVQVVAPASQLPPVGAVATAAVRVPEVVTPRGDTPSKPAPTVQTVVLPGAVLFRPDSPELLDRRQAVATLRGTADTIIHGSATVTIVGHTALDRDGMSAGTELSRQRAGAIRDLLVSLGVRPAAIGPVTGVGPRDPVVKNNPKDPGNRVVVVTITLRKNKEN